MGGVVVDQLLFRFSIWGFVSEIFAIKVEILGGRPSKNCTQVKTPGSRHVVWIKVCDGIPISSELIDVYTLNFKPVSGQSVDGPRRTSGEKKEDNITGKT